ncbi:MAG: glycosyltransferase [Acidobacteria bacterium]|nr:glycosyltransferase [Acidobacteriota bacterium]
MGKKHSYSSQIILQYPDYEWRITIADNGSVDGTDIIAKQLSESLPVVHFVHLTLKDERAGIAT